MSRTGRPRVGILHFTAPPIVGGVEAIVGEQANALLTRGYEVTVLAGRGGRFRVLRSGRRFRLHGKGMPVLRAKQTGDMYVQVVVETPQNLTKKQRDLLSEFDRLSSRETQPESAGFFNKVKEFLDGLGNRASSA